MTQSSGGREIACHRGGIARLLQAKYLTYSYLLPDGQYLKAVDNVDLEVKEGEVLAIVGQTGSGKSTLAHILANVIKPEQGEVSFLDGNVSEYNYEKRLNGIQIVFQDPFSSQATGSQYLMRSKNLLISIRSDPREDRLQMVKNALELVHLPDTDSFLSKYCGELSGGQRQRVRLPGQWSWSQNFLLRMR